MFYFVLLHMSAINVCRQEIMISDLRISAEQWFFCLLCYIWNSDLLAYIISRKLSGCGIEYYFPSYYCRYPLSNCWLNIWAAFYLVQLWQMFVSFLCHLIFNSRSSLIIHLLLLFLSSLAVVFSLLLLFCPEIVEGRSLCHNMYEYE